MSYNEKIESIADEVCEYVIREFNKEFYDKIRKQKRQCDFTEAYYKVYTKHFGDRVDHRTYDKISMLGGCMYCLFRTICESTMSVDDMITTMEKYIRLQVKTMNLWDV